MTAVQYTANQNSVLMLLTSDGHAVRPLSPPGGSPIGVREQQSAWSPDGRWIAYSICMMNLCGIRLVSLDGSAYRWLVGRSPDFAPQYPTWSPPISLPLRTGIVFVVGAALVLAGIAPWSRVAWASGPQAMHRKDRERPWSERP